MVMDGPTPEPRKAPLRTMSIARFIPRFTKPRLVTSHIPIYRHSFSLPIKQKEQDPTSSASPEKPTDSNAQANIPSSASYVEWSKLLPVPSNFLGSFRELFEEQTTSIPVQQHTATAEPKQIIATSSAPSASPPPRLVFFGEQHHQPQVMRAQLQTLLALHEQCQQASQSRPAHGSSPPIYRLHLILEQFSVLDQHMLNSFSLDQLGPDELAETYHAHSQEAFQIGHYMPLLMLAKELRVPIWGGFPPRSWARQVFRDGIDSVKADEERRVNLAKSFKAATPESTQHLPPTIPIPTVVPRPPLFTSWSAVTKIGAAHRSYLSGLMRPDMPPRFPQLPSPSNETWDADNTAHLSIYPTWLLKPHIIETKGFGPAQALKDSYLAHVTAWILCGACTDVPTPDDPNGQPAGAQSDSSSLNSTSSRAETDVSGRPIVNITLVICGLGHCEYGFGAPERVVELLSQRGTPSSSDDTAPLLPYIIASKPLDSGIWLGHEHQSQPSTSDDAISNARISPAAGEIFQLEPSQSTRASVDRWLADPWGRKLADAIVMYDWIDDEPDQEASTNADEHQPAAI